jgi:hypothetical protein
MAWGRRDLWAVGGPGGEVTDAWRTAAALIAVGATAGLATGSRGRCRSLAFHGRAWTRSFGRRGDMADLLVELVVVAVDAVGADGEKDGDAVPGPGGDLGGVPSGVQPR